MGATDKVIGTAFVTTAVVVFTYYLLWLLVGSGVVRSVHIGAAVAPRGVPSPPLAPPQPVPVFSTTLGFLFPFHRDWAIWIPAVLISVAVAVAGLFIATSLLCKKKKAAAAPAPQASEVGEAAPKGKGKGSKRR